MSRPGLFDQVLLASVRIGVFLVPLVSLVKAGGLFPIVFFPHVTMRNAVFRILVQVTFALGVALAVRNPAFRPRRSGLTLAFVGFVAVMGLANWAGVDPQRSWWSNLERWEGWAGLVHLLLYFIVASTVLRQPKHWLLYAHTWLLAALVVVADCVRQAFQQDWLQVVPDATGYFRLDARIGSPVYVAIFLALQVFVAALCWRRATAVWHRVALVTLLVAALGVIAGTVTRVASVGVGIGACVALVLFAWHQGSARARRWALAGSLGLVVLALVAAIILWLDPALLAEVPGLQRLRATGDHASLRWSLAQMCWQGFLESPWLGYGQENFGYVFERHYDPRFYGQETWWDHPHNVLLGWLIAGGLLGFAAYASLLALGFWSLWRKDLLGVSLADRSILTGMLVCYVVCISMQLDNLTSYLPLVSLLAFLQAMTPARLPTTSAKLAPGWLAALAGIAAMAVLPWTLESAVLRHVRAARALAACDQTVWTLQHDLREWRARSQQLASGSSPDPNAASHLRAVGEQLARRANHVKVELERAVATAANSSGLREARGQLVNWLGRLEGLPGLESLLALAQRELTIEVQEHPTRFRTLIEAGAFWRRAGRADQALTMFARAKDASPKRQLAWFAFAETLLVLGRIEEAQDAYRTGLALRPQSRPAQLQVLVGAITAGDRTLEDQLLADLGSTFRAAVFVPSPAISSALLSKQRFDRVVQLFEPVVANARQELQRTGGDLAAAGITPDSLRYRFGTLADALAALGQTQKAADLLQELARLDASPEGRAMVQQALDGYRRRR